MSIMATEPLWSIKDIKKKEDGQPFWITLVDPAGWWRAEVKWDGCVHFYHYHNIPYDPNEANNKEENIDYMHLCSINEVIERLTALKTMAQEASLWSIGNDNGL